ncbi:hypothetical protein PIB30_104539 [Stylosanthes scabra]|uniref:Uncharacterized protein n=1 Tax=Stylosanthes scabra TaxID=79078 RepID=A0ABU6VWR0_9FABA|nr:hypothetical protein [Stylosanthes scabra]
MATHGAVTTENTKDGFGHANTYLGDGTLSDITHVYAVPVAGGSALPPSAKSKENCDPDSDGGLGSTIAGSADSTIVAREGQCRAISTISAEDARLERRKRKARLAILRAPAETNTGSGMIYVN